MSVQLEQANKALGSAYTELQLRNDSLQMQEVELRTRNERFDAALNNMSHGLCMVDANERIIVFNARFAQLFCLDSTVRPGTTLRGLVAHLDGLSREEVVGLNIPTGQPLRYELDEMLRPVTRGGQYLDPEAAADAAAAVAAQGH